MVGLGYIRDVEAHSSSQKRFNILVIITIPDSATVMILSCILSPFAGQNHDCGTVWNCDNYKNIKLLLRAGMGFHVSYVVSVY
jgi:hypothetical protein